MSRPPASAGGHLTDAAPGAFSAGRIDPYVNAPNIVLARAIATNESLRRQTSPAADTIWLLVNVLTFHDGSNGVVTAESSVRIRGEPEVLALKVSAVPNQYDAINLWGYQLGKLATLYQSAVNDKFARVQ